LKDLGIYAIGNLGSKIITFVMVAVYTHYISKSDMGYYDLCLTVIFLILPFVTLQLRDGAFRFLLETDAGDRTQRSCIITFVYRTLVSNTAISLVAAIAMVMFIDIDYVWYCFALLIVMSFFEVITQVARGLGKNVEFVIAGIISSFGILLFSVVFLIILPWGLAGIFIANILARVVALIYLEFRLKLISTYLNINVDFKQVARDLIKYSLPLLPGSLCWWLTGSSDRWFINYYLGLDVNGVYAVAFRFNSIILILSTIFYQAWQETAILQYNSPDRDKFFSKMFNTYIGLQALLITVFVFALKLFVYPLFIEEKFQESANYLYLMGISAVLFALSAFFDMGYQCAKDTSRTLPAIVLAAIVNIVCNLILVKQIGVYGAIATSIITYAVLFFYRLLDMKRYFKLSFFPQTIIAIIIIIVGAAAYHFIDNWWLSLLYMVVACLLTLLSIPKDTLNDLKFKILQKLSIIKQ